jgi:hypothetical protein
MRRLIILLWFLAPAICHAQGASFSLPFLNQQGLPLAGAKVAICPHTVSPPAACTAGFSTIYANVELSGAPLANPTTVDAYGNLNVYLAPGKYDYTVSGNGITATTYTFTVQCAPGTACTFSTITSSTANPAATGFVRMASTDLLNWRNNANSADVSLSKNSSDNLVWPNGLSLGGGTALTTTNQSGTGNLCMTTSCVMTTPTIGAATATTITSASANPALTGFIRLASTDIIPWRNNANNGDLTLSKLGAASGNMPADTLIWDSTNANAFSAGAFIQNGAAASVASAGALRLHNTDKIAWRDAANATNHVIGEIQSIRGVTGCTTAASIGAVCSTTVTWSSAFVDTSYTLTGCTGNGITSGAPLIQGIIAKAAASVTVQTIALTAAAAQFTNVECGAIHD